MIGKTMNVSLWIISMMLIPVSLPADPIPDTGQTKCYDNSREIPCPEPGQPFYGQDGSYTITPPSFTKLGQNGVELPVNATQGDGWIMIHDNVTGLIWEIKTDDGSIHDRQHISQNEWDLV